MITCGEVRTNDMAQAHSKRLLVDFNRRPTWITRRTTRFQPSCPLMNLHFSSSSITGIAATKFKFRYLIRRAIRPGTYTHLPSEALNEIKNGQTNITECG
jgi:hypothetical protein